MGNYTMNEYYIVAFKSGSSGRLIGNIIWGLLQDGNHPYALTDYNSTHDFTPYAVSFTIPSSENEARIYSNDQVYKRFMFVTDPGVITLHAFPDFDTIAARYPTAKTIVISYDEDDFVEISGNSLLKNGFETLSRPDPKHNNDSQFLGSIYYSVFGESYTGQNIPMHYKKEIFRVYERRVRQEFIDTSLYINPVVPDSCLVLNYKDIHSNMILTLEKLCAFTNRKPKDHVTSMYQDYILGRRRLIDIHMPWLNDK